MELACGLIRRAVPGAVTPPVCGCCCPVATAPSAVWDWCRGAAVLWCGQDTACALPLVPSGRAAWISPTPGLGAGRGAPPAPGHHQNPAFAPASLSSRQDPGVRLCSGSLCSCSTSPGRAAGPESGQPSGGWGPGQAGAAGAAAGGCGGCSCLWLRQRLRHTLVLRDTETSHHGLLFKQDEGFYFFSLPLRIPHGFQR